MVFCVSVPVSCHCQRGLVKEVDIGIFEPPSVGLTGSCAVSAVVYLVGGQTKGSEGIGEKTQGEP